MYYKVEEVFNYTPSLKLKVVATKDELVHRRRVICCRRCYFYVVGGCKGTLSKTGDCQSRWREDHQSIHFEIAD